MKVFVLCVWLFILVGLMSIDSYTRSASFTTSDLTSTHTTIVSTMSPYIDVPLLLVTQ